MIVKDVWGRLQLWTQLAKQKPMLRIIEHSCEIHGFIKAIWPTTMKLEKKKKKRKKSSQKGEDTVQTHENTCQKIKKYKSN